MRGRLALVAGLLVLLAPAAAPAQSGLEIMQKQRALHRVRDEEEHQRVRLVSKSGAVKERAFVRWVKSGADDLEKILVRFTAPRDVEGTGLLTWEARDGDDDQWLYLPATRRAKRIASSGKKNRFMGTDFAYEDLRPESLGLHRYTLAGEETVDGRSCFVVEAVPATERQAADSGYGKRRIWVDRTSYVVVKREYFDTRGRLEKVERLRRFVHVAGSVWRADEVEMQDVRDGTRTVIAVESRAVNRGLTDDFFTEAELTR